MAVISSSALAQDGAPGVEQTQRTNPAQECHEQIKKTSSSAKTRDKRERMTAMAACLKSKHAAIAAKLSQPEAQ
ncbi:hypothetical protein [Roseateles sp.]|uniref:hypothetical protein n=1 Tax=Roseateles sp. TaxID=1971397 RepID=UPI0039EC0793